MKKPLIYFLCLYIVSIAFINPATAQKTNNITIGYLESYEKLPKIKFERSSESEYNRYKANGEPSMLKLQENKTHFTLPAQGQKNKFKKTNQEQNDFDGYEYFGYYPKLKMYAVTENSIADNLTFSTFMLIDSATAHQYSIISIGDGAVETPISSTNGNYLLYYYNRLYDGDSCFIGLLEVNKNGKPAQRFKEKMSFDTENFAVESVKFINDKNFIVKTYVTEIINDKRIKKFTYFKSTIK